MRALRNIVIVAMVLLVIAVVVVWTLPAQMAWHMFGSRNATVQLSGISGSVWHGHANQVRASGAALGALDWQLQLAPLLHGQMRASTRLSGGPIQARGEVWRDHDGRVEIHAMHLDVPAQELQTMVDMPQLRLRGSVDGFIDHAVIKGVWFEALKASARWKDAGVSGSAQARFGDVLTDFHLDGARHVIGVIHDTGKGPLAVQGKFDATLVSYTLVVHLRARDPDNLNLQEALMHLGQRQPDGSVVMRVSGRAQTPSL